MVQPQFSAVARLAPPQPSAAAIACVRAWTQRLRTAGYHEAAVRECFGVRYPDEMSASERAVWQLRLAPDTTPLAVFLRAFWLEDAVPRSLLEEHAGSLVDRALRVGLLVGGGSTLRSRLRAEPVGTTIVWADRRFVGAAPGAVVAQRGGPVYPPSADSFLLAEVVPVCGGDQVLDLCTGAGVLALVCAQRGARAYGVDVDPRAVALARANAAANRVSRVHFALGDLYSPVGSSTFDCVVANPPFVCSPYSRGPRYHSGGPRGDRVLAQVIRGWAVHLRPGGKAVSIAHAGLGAGEELGDRASQWFADFDGRATVVEFARADALTFAAAQAAFALAEGLRAYRREVQLWLRFLTRHGIRDIAAFFVAAQRTGRRQLDVVRALPIAVHVPLRKSAAQVLADWWAA